MKKALFGGSFDPIHFGHINMALEMKEHLELDEIIFCPNFISPNKVNAPPIASAEDRLTMVKIAIQEIDGFSILDFEAKKKEISYTIDTLMYLKKNIEFKDFSLIIFQDIFKDFFKWKDYKKILNLVNLYVGCKEIIENDKINKKNFILIKNLEISSTGIRNRLQKGFYCSHLTHQKVLDYIRENSLY